MNTDMNGDSNGNGNLPVQQPATSFQRFRRRLTVTGGMTDSTTIDGVSKLSVSEQQQKEQQKQKDESSTQETQVDTTRNPRDTFPPCAVHKFAGMSKKGHAPYNPRKENQDALIMTDDNATNTIILCTLDGHGEHGDGVAQAFRDDLAQAMIQHPKWTTDVKQAAADSIQQIEAAIIRNFRVDTEFSGTTLSMAIIRGNTITGVNIGDSRVIIGKSNEDAEKHGRGGHGHHRKQRRGSARSCSSKNSIGYDYEILEEEFTHDHKPDNVEEKKRILEAGGRVFAVEYDDGIDGPPRVWLGHIDVPGLAMSRSLGDCVAHTAGVISEPEFTERELDPATDKFIVVATDGLWEFVNNKETADMVHSCTAPTQAVDVLVTEANARWMKEEQVIDDTTVICAYLFDYKR